MSDIENLDVMLGVSENEVADQISEIMTCGSHSLPYNRQGMNLSRGELLSQENEFVNVNAKTNQNTGENTFRN